MSDTSTDELTCQPIDTYAELMTYVKNLPPWASLCKELTPHSEFKIHNMDIHIQSEIYLDEPQTFCHINTNAEDPPRTESRHLPKTLVCHDMANGYHDDSYIDGTENRNAYTFYNWAGIDIFCYFSHHLITIPPLSWINAAHAHGVKVIGTVITEWNEGIRFWEQVLESETMFQNTAGALVAIAKALKFDGWLLNVENKIAKPKLLLEFVQHLKYLLHEEIPHSELIWYDSVTIEGHLNWQNALNDKNRPFFDACDGIFTNYSWTEFDITTSAIEAGDRVTDLYIGIDVWGRNFYGGGRFNTQSAIKVAHDEGCSLAIFAPAWTHEAMSTDSKDPNYIAMAEELDAGQQFRLRDRALWGSFWPFLNTRLPCLLPFKTSFCQGYGKKNRVFGKETDGSPWYNPRHQQYQPNSAHGPHGYLLSSDAVIRNMSTRGVFKDTKGILRVRESFQASRMELFSMKPKPKVEPHKSEEYFESDVAPQKVDQTAIDGNLIASNQIDPKSPTEDPETFVPQPASTRAPERKTAIRQKPARKRTLKECLKEFFGTKSDNRKVLLSGSEHKDRENSMKLAPTADTSASVPKKIFRNEESSSELAGGSSYSALASSGRSMQTLSVNLRLGQGSAGARPAIALATVPQERECLEVYQEDSFTGGACLRVHPADEVCAPQRYSRLLHADFPVHSPLLVCVVTKPLPEFPDQYLSVHLHTVSETGVRKRVILSGRDIPALAPASPGAELVLAPLATAGPQFKEAQAYLLTHENAFYVPIENGFGWNVRYYSVPQLAGSRVTSVNVCAGRGPGPVLLGHLGLCPQPRAASHGRPGDN